VEFGAAVTIVRGPSDTGKSFIVDAVDFMLGGRTLKDIPERIGYNTVLLGLRLPDGQEVTLRRSASGGRFVLYRERVTTLSGAADPQGEALSPKHADQGNNVSLFLLTALGLDGKRLRKNKENDTVSLSFRDLAHLCIINETKMQSDTPPALSGQHVTKTKESSVLKLLLQDEDDSSLVRQESDSERHGSAAAKIELLSSLIAAVEARLADEPGEAELRDQLTRLSRAVDDQTAVVSGLMDDRNQVVSAIERATTDLTDARRNAAESSALRARLELLEAQYESDLGRLAMIAEAGNLLGYFKPGTCVFCGAEPEYQHYNRTCPGESTAFQQSVKAEADKTRELHHDLIATVADLDAEVVRLQQAIDSSSSRIEELNRRLRQADDAIKPDRDALTQLVNKRSEIEKALALYSQIADYRSLSARLEDSEPEHVPTAVTKMALQVEREFSSDLAQRLIAWQVADAATTTYDRGAQDIKSGDQFRAGHGKGVRAILHAAFTLGIAGYCLSRDIAHPGFTVLDSPVVTYREPDAAPSVGDDEESVSLDVVKAFYRDIQTASLGQIIVIENTDPPEPLLPETTDIKFTKNPTSGRYGFFPHVAQASSPAAD
jgi:seryl-tRNA synthetase